MRTLGNILWFILDFLDMSYDLIDGAGRKENK